MADDTNRTPKRGPSDATDYSSTKAPETRKEAEEHHPHPSDTRLQPGGAHGAKADPGMSSLDRDAALSGGESSGQADYTQPPAKGTE
jgi:hypothetical protein